MIEEELSKFDRLRDGGQVEAGLPVLGAGVADFGITFEDGLYGVELATGAGEEVLFGEGGVEQGVLVVAFVAGFSDLGCC